MADVKMSKAQKRVGQILNLNLGDSYESAKLTLEAAGYEGSAVPQGRTWREAAKMSDTELIATIRISAEDKLYRQGYRETPEYGPSW